MFKKTSGALLIAVLMLGCENTESPPTPPNPEQSAPQAEIETIAPPTTVAEAPAAPAISAPEAAPEPAIPTAIPTAIEDAPAYSAEEAPADAPQDTTTETEDDNTQAHE